jgi:hypothetical protein
MPGWVCASSLSEAANIINQSPVDSLKEKKPHSSNAFLVYKQQTLRLRQKDSV